GTHEYVLPGDQVRTREGHLGKAGLGYGVTGDDQVDRARGDHLFAALRNDRLKHRLVAQRVGDLFCYVDIQAGVVATGVVVQADSRLIGLDADAERTVQLEQGSVSAAACPTRRCVPGATTGRGEGEDRDGAHHSERRQAGMAWPGTGTA